MYKIFISKHFKKQLKPLLKKDQNLKNVLKNELKLFDKKKCIPIGSGVFKFRLKKNGLGKSSGYRIYVFIIEFEGILTPVSIYSKSDQSNISKLELAKDLEKIKEELQCFYL